MLAPAVMGLGETELTRTCVAPLTWLIVVKVGKICLLAYYWDLMLLLATCNELRLYRKAGFGLRPVALLSWPAHLEKCSDCRFKCYEGVRQVVAAMALGSWDMRLFCE